MPSVCFSHRLFFDKDFYNTIVKGDAKSNERPNLLIKLMNINSRSKEHRREHNTISHRTFDNILQANKSLSWETLRASIYPLNEPTDIEAIEDEIVRNIKHAIELISQPPFKTIIMTSDTKKSEYETNPHYVNAPRTVTLLSGQDCVDFINDYFKSCARS